MLLGGALLTTVFVLLMSPTATYMAPLALIFCQQVSENFSRAAIKGVLPDLVGTNQMARASSINGILSIGGPDDGATAGGPPASPRIRTRRRRSWRPKAGRAPASRSS